MVYETYTVMSSTNIRTHPVGINIFVDFIVISSHIQ